MQQKTYRIYCKQGVKAFTSLRFGAERHPDAATLALPYAGMDFCPYAGNNPDIIRQNRRIFCQQNAINPKNLFFPRQTHSCNVIEIDSDFLKKNEEEQADRLQGVDALITRQPGVFLGIFTADCMAVFLYDPAHRAIGLAHSGWRGTVQKIVLATIAEMRQRYGTRPQDLLVAVAPHISTEDYEVGDELTTAFAEAGFDTHRIFKKGKSPRHRQLNLSAAIRQTLEEAGVPRKQVEISRECSYQHPEKYFSARRLGAASGRTAHCIGLRPLNS